MNQLQFQSSIGNLVVNWNPEGRLTGIDWQPIGAEAPPTPETDYSWTARGQGPIPITIVALVTRLQRYFDAGEPIGEVPWEHLEQSGLTEFQLQVYRRLAEVPHGETRSYSWLARKIGKASATRAVGQALRRNPFPILVPCHRVVSVTTLGGFMGKSDPQNPEMLLKQRLLDLESSYLNPVFSFLTGSLKALTVS